MENNQTKPEKHKEENFFLTQSGSVKSEKDLVILAARKLSLRISVE